MCASLGSLAPQESLRLWLLSAATVERADWATHFSKMGPMCSRFIESGLSCLEVDIREPQAQFRGLQLLVSTLRQATCLDASQYGLAANRAVRFGSQLPAKRLQSQALCLCSTLFWCPARREPAGAMCCLRQALQLADSAVHIDPLAVDLFVDVLDQTVHLFGNGNSEVSAPFLSGLLMLCIQHMRYVESRLPVNALRALHTTVEDLQTKHEQALQRASAGGNVDPLDARYAALHLAIGMLPELPGLPSQKEAIKESA